MSIISFPAIHVPALLKVTGYAGFGELHLEFEEETNEPPEVIEGEFVVQLLKDGEPPEIVYRSDADTCLHWAREWLKKPLGLTVAIVPVVPVDDSTSDQKGGRCMMTREIIEPQPTAQGPLTHIDQIPEYKEGPWLYCAVVNKDGSIGRIVLIADPRSMFCKAYNDIDDSDRAVPVSNEALKAWLKGGAQ